MDPEGVTYATGVHNFDFMKLLKDGDFVVMLNGFHRPRSFEILGDKYGMERAAEPLLMSYNQVHGDLTLPAQVMKLSKIVNISTEIRRRKVTLTEMIQSLLRHTGAF